MVELVEKWKKDQKDHTEGILEGISVLEKLKSIEYNFKEVGPNH